MEQSSSSSKELSRPTVAQRSHVERGDHSHSSSAATVVHVKDLVVFTKLMDTLPPEQWRQRCDALEVLVSSIPAADSSCPPAQATWWFHSPQHLRHLASPLCRLLRDPRSAVVRRCSESTASLFSKCQSDARYLFHDCMPSILAVQAETSATTTTNVHRTCVNALVMLSIPLVPCRAVLPLWLERLRHDKCRTVREACALYLCRALECWTTTTTTNNDGYLTLEIWNNVAQTLAVSLRDEHPMVRTLARQAFELVRAHHPRLWRRVMEDLWNNNDSTVKLKQSLMMKRGAAMDGRGALEQEEDLLLWSEEDESRSTETFSSFGGGSVPRNVVVSPMPPPPPPPPPIFYMEDVSTTPTSSSSKRRKATTTRTTSLSSIPKKSRRNHLVATTPTRRNTTPRRRRRRRRQVFSTPTYENTQRTTFVTATPTRSLVAPSLDTRRVASKREQGSIGSMASPVTAACVEDRDRDEYELPISSISKQKLKHSAPGVVPMSPLPAPGDDDDTDGSAVEESLASATRSAPYSLSNSSSNRITNNNNNKMLLWSKDNVVESTTCAKRSRLYVPLTAALAALIVLCHCAVAWPFCLLEYDDATVELVKHKLFAPIIHDTAAVTHAFFNKIVGHGTAVEKRKATADKMFSSFQDEEGIHDEKTTERTLVDNLFEMDEKEKPDDVAYNSSPFHDEEGIAGTSTEHSQLDLLGEMNQKEERDATNKLLPDQDKERFQEAAKTSLKHSRLGHLCETNNNDEETLDATSVLDNVHDTEAAKVEVPMETQDFEAEEPETKWHDDLFDVVEYLEYYPLLCTVHADMDETKAEAQVVESSNAGDISWQPENVVDVPDDVEDLSCAMTPLTHPFLASGTEDDACPVDPRRLRKDTNSKSQNDFSDFVEYLEYYPLQCPADGTEQQLQMIPDALDAGDTESKSQDIVVISDDVDDIHPLSRSMTMMIQLMYPFPSTVRKDVCPLDPRFSPEVLDYLHTLPLSTAPFRAAKAFQARPLLMKSSVKEFVPSLLYQRMLKREAALAEGLCPSGNVSWVTC